MIPDVFYISRDTFNYQYLNEQVNSIEYDFGTSSYIYKWAGMAGYFVYSNGSIYVDYKVRSSYKIRLIDPELFILYCKIKKANDKRENNTSTISS